MEALSFEWLLAIGIVLVGLEALTFSFFIFPIGVGFLIVALLELWILDFESFFSQGATVVSIGLVFILLFRQRFINIIEKTSSNSEDRVHTSGVGTVDGKQIKFEGTYWNTNDDLSSFNDGDKIDIEIIKNKAVIKK